MSYEETLNIIEQKINSVVELVEREKDQVSSLTEHVERDIRTLLLHEQEGGAIEAFRMKLLKEEDCLIWYKILINFPGARETSDIDIAIDRDYGPFWLGGTRHYSSMKKRNL